MGRRKTPQWKPNSHHKPHKPNSSGDKFQAPTADLFSFGFSRCCCQFGHQGVLRSGVATLLLLSLWWPLRCTALLCTATGPHYSLWEELQPGSCKCFHFSGKPTNQLLPPRKAEITLSSTSPKGEGVYCDTVLLHIWSINLYCSGPH